MSFKILNTIRNSALSLIQVFSKKYEAKVLRVIDGDSFVVMLDLGCDFFAKKTIRLYGINTPEIRGEERPEGLKAKARVEELIGGKEVYVETVKNKDKYGRMLAKIKIIDTDEDLTQILLKEGFGHEYYGK